MSIPQGVSGGIMGQSSGLPPWVAPVVGGITNAAKGLFGWIGQRKQNKIQREYEQRMYEQNKADQLAFWNMQNEYNSPAAQMERLKKAGLNPNLVYGNGADAQSGDLRVPGAQTSNSTQFQNPFPDHNIMSQILGMRQTSAQTDLLRSQIETQESVQKLNAYTALLTAVNAKKGSVELNFLPRQLEAAIGKTLSDTINTRTRTRTETIVQDKLHIEMKNMVDENSRKWIDQRWSIRDIASQMAKRLQDIKESNSRISVNNSHIKNMDQDTLKKEIETQILNYMQNYKETYGIDVNASPFQKLQHFGMQSVQDFKQFLSDLAHKLQPGYYEEVPIKH